MTIIHQWYFLLGSDDSIQVMLKDASSRAGLVEFRLKLNAMKAAHSQGKEGD